MGLGTWDLRNKISVCYQWATSFGNFSFIELIINVMKERNNLESIFLKSRHYTTEGGDSMVTLGICIWVLPSTITGTDESDHDFFFRDFPIVTKTNVRLEFHLTTFSNVSVRYLKLELDRVGYNSQRRHSMTYLIFSTNIAYMVITNDLSDFMILLLYYFTYHHETFKLYTKTRKVSFCFLSQPCLSFIPR